MDAAPAGPARTAAGASTPDAGHGHDALLRFLSHLGHVLIASGEAVAVSEDVIRRIARAPGVHASVVAFPTLLFVKIDDGTSGHRDWTSEECVTRGLTRGYISIILEP